MENAIYIGLSIYVAKQACYLMFVSYFFYLLYKTVIYAWGDSNNEAPDVPIVVKAVKKHIKLWLVFCVVIISLPSNELILSVMAIDTVVDLELLDRIKPLLDVILPTGGE